MCLKIRSPVWKVVEPLEDEVELEKVWGLTIIALWVPAELFTLCPHQHRARLLLPQPWMPWLPWLLRPYLQWWTCSIQILFWTSLELISPLNLASPEHGAMLVIHYSPRLLAWKILWHSCWMTFPLFCLLVFLWYLLLEMWCIEGKNGSQTWLGISLSLVQLQRPALSYFKGS